jgi:hypothetical protein
MVPDRAFGVSRVSCWFFEIVLHEILVLKFHVFNIIDFWPFLTLLFHCLVVFRNTGWIRGLFFGCNGMEGGWIVV